MKARYIIGFCLAGMLASSLLSKEIAMDEFLSLAIRNHPFFEKESLATEIEVQKNKGLLGSQDWIVSSSPYYSYQEVVSSNSFSPERITAVGGGIGLDRTIWSTGGRLSVSWNSDFTDQDVSDMVIPFPTGDLVIQADESRFFSHKIWLSYSQPLMQNYRGRLDRLEFELGKFAIDISRASARENKENFILDLSIRFLDWYFLDEQRRIVNERLNLAHELLQRVKKRRAAFLVDRIDVLRAEDAVSIARQNMVLIESQYKAKGAELATLTNSDELTVMHPILDLYGIDTLPGIDDMVDSLSEKSELLKLLAINREQLLMFLGGYEELARARLFLNIGAGLAGGDSEFDNSLEITNPGISISLAYRRPIGNRSAKSDIEETKLAIKLLEKEMDGVALDLEAAVRSSMIQIKEMEKVLSLNREQIESAKKKTAEENSLYNQGRGDLTFVIQSRDNEQNAELTYARNAAIYRTLVLQYRALVDELYRSVFDEQ